MADAELTDFLLASKPVAFRPELARATGSVKAGLFLGQLLYWQGKGTKGEWIYKTIKEFEEETALSRHEQDSAILRLKQLGLLEVKLIGVPARRHFRVSLPELRKLVCRKVANWIAENRQTNTENTTEITTVDSKLSTETGVSGDGKLVLSYGNGEVNEVLSHLKDSLSLPALDGSERINRQYAWNLLKASKTGLEGVKWLIDQAASDGWWRNHITSTRDLWNNKVKIVSSKRSSVKVYAVEN